MKRRLIASCIAVLAILALTAGSCDPEGTGDAPVGKQHETERQVWVNPDHYSNVVAHCIGGNGVYVITDANNIVVVPSDPECAENGVLRD